MKRFNTTGLCIPDKHYMVDINDKLRKIKMLVDDGAYFTINRARQYGKTTTLYLLEKLLVDEYVPVSISFEGVDYTGFATPQAFCSVLIKLISRALKFTNASQEYIDRWKHVEAVSFTELSELLTDMCERERLVLLIDEVDKISNNEVFLHFLGMLREKYLSRNANKDFTFQSVILAGVSDIKNIKLLMTEKGYVTPREGERIFNSPWNIAVDFKVDMSFSSAEITTMLVEYEGERKTGMDIAAVANELYSYTSGYPFLVSYICKCIDEDLERNWSAEGIQSAVKILLETPSTLLDDLGKNLENNKKLYDLLYDVLIKGEIVQYQFSNPAINIGSMYGIIKNNDGRIAVSNRIFEVFIYNHFISKIREERTPSVSGVLAYDVIENGRFNMQLCLEMFAKHFAQTFTVNDSDFLEQHGRQVFLTYLKPLINGQGFYHVESQLLDLRRMDIVVDYNREQFIVELKLWRGERKHEDAYAQLAGYLESRGTACGYLLTFDLRKEGNKAVKAEWVEACGKRIFDVIV